MPAEMQWMDAPKRIESTSSAGVLSFTLWRVWRRSNANESLKISKTVEFNSYSSDAITQNRLVFAKEIRRESACFENGL